MNLTTVGIGSVDQSEEARKPRIAIIGAGPAGLAAIKQCIDDQLDMICFEQNEHIAGLWRYVEIDETNPDPHSSVYKTTVINTSKETMSFSDFPIPQDWPTFLPNPMIAKYYDMYADHFNLRPHIKLNCKVVQISQLSDGRWKVRYAYNNDDLEQEEEFDYVMVCTGHHRKHRWPTYIGMESFGGKQLHSHFYRDPTKFYNKRVVVVGLGNSGVDISVELSHVASQVYISSRRGTIPWVIPRRSIFGKPMDHSMTRFSKKIPRSISNYINETIINMLQGPHSPELKPKTPFYAEHATIKTDFPERLSTGTIIVKPDIMELNADRSIKFADGTTIEDIDFVIYATGYKIDFPFLDRDVITGGKEIEEATDPEYRGNLAWLYKMMFPPRYHNIAFLGLAQPQGPIMPISELQARYVNGLIKGRIDPLPSALEMDKSIKQYQVTCSSTFYSSPRHTIQIDFLTYCDQLASEIGCLPTPRNMFSRYGFKGLKIYFFGIPTPVQYRLFGPHAWEDAMDWVEVYNYGGKPRRTLLDNKPLVVETNGHHKSD
ncbi:hypothetical protein G9A89_015652 [Geosiphon pyriformis]|nr:hypothetical protein G9A89_015652 [Geosiphon pyriformis]